MGLLGLEDLPAMSGKVLKENRSGIYSYDWHIAVEIL